MNLNIIVSIFTLFALMAISLFVLWENYYSSINRTFFFLCMTISTWVIFNLLGDLFFTPEITIFFYKVSVISPLFIPILLSRLIAKLYYYDDHEYNRRNKIMESISFLFVIIIILLHQTSFNISSIKVHQWGIEFVPGYLYYIVLIYIVLTFSFSFYYLIRTVFKSVEPIRYQASLILLGSFLTILVGTTTNVILPLFGNSFFAVFGSSSILFFLTCIAIAITKHHLFDIKVIAIQIIIFALWIFLFIRVLFVKTPHDLLVEGAVFIISLTLGILLIRSVLTEMRQRKKIEILTEDISKACKYIKELESDLFLE